MRRPSYDRDRHDDKRVPIIVRAPTSASVLIAQKTVIDRSLQGLRRGENNRVGKYWYIRSMPGRDPNEYD